MSRRSIVAGVAIVALSCTACSSASLTARNTVNPVLVGPVRALGPGRPPAFDDVGAFTSESTELASASTSDTAVTSERAHSAATQNDWDVLVATSGDPTRQVVVERFACSGYVFGAFWLGGFVRETKCRLEGDVYRPFTPRRPQADR